MDAGLNTRGCDRGPNAHRRRCGSVLLLAAALAACGDAHPTGTVPPEPAAGELRMDCRVSVREARMACIPAAPEMVGALGDLTLGQGRVALASTGASYDGAAVFRVDVRLRNLIQQAIGTTDGAAVAPQGIRVFFFQGPSASQGSGPVEVANPSGRAFFTGADQPYFQYDTVLGPGEWSAFQEWRFTCPPSVLVFSFSVYVRVPVAPPRGRVRMDLDSVYLVPGGRLALRPEVWDENGQVVEGEALGWTSSNPAVVGVEVDGVATAVAVGGTAGTATIRAATVWPAPWREPATTTVVVTAADARGPYLERITVSPGTVDLNPPPSPPIVIDLKAADVSVTRAARVEAADPSGRSRESCDAVSIGEAAGVSFLRCELPLRQDMPRGRWSLSVRMVDRLGNETVLDAAALQARGHPSGFTVTASPPQIRSLSITPASVDVTAAPAQVTFSLDITAAQERAVSWGDLFIAAPSDSARQPPSHLPLQRCRLLPAAGVPTNGTWTCALTISRYAEPGEWAITDIFLHFVGMDGYSVRFTRAQLEAAGHAPHFRVRDDSADVEPPALVGFAILADSVAPGEGLPFTAAFTDLAGVRVVRIGVDGPDEQSGNECLMQQSAGTVHDGTWSCAMHWFAPYAPPGPGRVAYVYVEDAVRNNRVITGDELEQAGYDIHFTITP